MAHKGTIYLAGQRRQGVPVPEEILEVPPETLVALFTLQYCQSRCLHVVVVPTRVDPRTCTFPVSVDSLCFDVEVKGEEECPEVLGHTELPAMIPEEEVEEEEGKKQVRNRNKKVNCKEILREEKEEEGEEEEEKKEEKEKKQEEEEEERKKQTRHKDEEEILEKQLEKKEEEGEEEEKKEEKEEEEEEEEDGGGDDNRGETRRKNGDDTGGDRCKNGVENGGEARRKNGDDGGGESTCKNGVENGGETARGKDGENGGESELRNGDDSGGDRCRNGDDSGGDRCRSGDDSGGDKCRNGDDSGGDRCKSGDDSGGDGCRSGDDSGGDRCRNGDDSGGDRCRNGDDSGGESNYNNNNGGETRRRNGAGNGVERRAGPWCCAGLCSALRLAVKQAAETRTLEKKKAKSRRNRNAERHTDRGAEHKEETTTAKNKIENKKKNKNSTEHREAGKKENGKENHDSTGAGNNESRRNRRRRKMRSKEENEDDITTTNTTSTPTTTTTTASSTDDADSNGGSDAVTGAGNSITATDGTREAVGTQGNSTSTTDNSSNTFGAHNTCGNTSITTTTTIDNQKNTTSNSTKADNTTNTTIDNQKNTTSNSTKADNTTTTTTTTITTTPHHRNTLHHAASLLGFRGGCLQACAEVSVWTKFCEVEAPTALLSLALAPYRGTEEEVTYPRELLRYECHLRRPPILHNALKRTQRHIRETVEDGTKRKELIHRSLAQMPPLTHEFAEGPDMTLADLMLFSCFHLLLVSLTASGVEPLAITPLVHAWHGTMALNRHVQMALPVLEGAKAVFCGTCRPGIPPRVVVPRVSDVSIYKSDPERSRTTRGAFTKQGDVEEVLEVVGGAGVEPQYTPWPPYSTSFSSSSSLTSTSSPSFFITSNSSSSSSTSSNSSPSFSMTSNSSSSSKPPPLHTLLPALSLEGHIPECRLERKGQQVENICSAVLGLALPGHVVVDFCSGGGHVGIALAQCLPGCHVLLVENKVPSLERAKERVRHLRLRNVSFVQTNLDYFRGRFDIGVSLHACGGATDLVLGKCVAQGAAFVVAPCCYGSIRPNHVVSYPRSLAFRSLPLTVDQYLTLGHAADQTHGHDNPKTEQGQRCMRLVDGDRLAAAREAGYVAGLALMHPPTCSPKNHILLGKPRP